MIVRHLQVNIDASKLAALIEKQSAIYEQSPEYRFMVDNTVFFTPEEIQHSLSVVGTCKELPPSCGL